MSPQSGRQLGNFPQAFSHVGIVNTANNLISRAGPAAQQQRRECEIDGIPRHRFAEITV